jgi:hypothetical protein
MQSYERNPALVKQPSIPAICSLLVCGFGTDGVLQRGDVHNFPWLNCGDCLLKLSSQCLEKL